MTKDEALKLALEALEWSYGGEPMPTKELEAMNAIRQVLAEWTPDDTAYRPDGLSQEELPPVKSYCGGKPNYCEPEMDKQCSSCGGFCGDVCEREDVKPDLLNQTCCECGRSGGFALYCGWCWSKGDKPVDNVNTSEERVPNSDKQGHERQDLKASGPIGEIIEAHGLIAVAIPEMPPVGTKLYAAPYRLWVTLSDDDIKEIVGGWGDAPISGFTRKLFDEIDFMYRKRNYG